MKGRGLELEFVEIGNEPDLYGGNGHRNSSWNVQEYVQQYVLLSFRYLLFGFLLVVA